METKIYLSLLIVAITGFLSACCSSDADCGTVEECVAACDEGLGSGLACYSAGMSLREGQGISQDMVEGRRLLMLAAPMLEEQCSLEEGGDDDACFSLGYMSATGVGTARDLDKSLTYYGHACDAGNGSACSNIGSTYFAGKGPIRRDNYKAYVAFKKACDLDLGRGCAGAGLLKMEGQGVKRDLFEATELAEKGCDLKDAEACRLLKEVCKKGSKDACDYFD